VPHYNDPERIALVGDRKWEERVAKLCKPFTRVRVQYFGAPDIMKALGVAPERILRAACPL
jgi:hypothetical protein